MPPVTLKTTPMGEVNGVEASVSASIRKFILLLVFGVCFSIFGCDGPKTTWSAESRSPDGKMIATARTIQTSGIGTGDPGTFVYLNWTTGSQSPTIILALLDGSDEPGGMSVGMNWLTPTHLDLTYKGRKDLDFQAVKCHGIDISVRDLGSEKAQTGAVDSNNGTRNLPTPPPIAYQKTAAGQANH